MRYFEYARKSTEAKERQALSIEDQISENAKVASSNSLQVIDTYQDSKTAYKPHKRLQFNAMLSMLRSGEADAILTWKADRLARNPLEGGILIQMLQDGQIQEIRCSSGDTYTKDSDHLMLQLHFGVANSYSRNLAKDTKRGLDHKVLRGEYPRSAPIGYDQSGPDGYRNLVENPTEAPIIKEMFERAATGVHSLKSLEVWANGLGLSSKRFKSKMNHTQVRFILTNPVYYGVFRWRGELFPGKYEPLISKAIFDKVQIALRDRGKPKHLTGGLWINGLIKCKSCGCAVTTTIKRKYYPKTDRNAIYYYNRCTRKRGKCTQAPVTFKNLKQQILDNISNIQISKKEYDLGMALVRARHESEGKKQDIRKENAGMQLELMDRKLYKLSDMLIDNLLTKEEYLSHKNKLVEETARLRNITKDNWHSQDSWLELVENFLNTALQARKVLDHGEDEEKIKLINKLGSNLYLNDKKLEFRFNKPFDVLLKPRNSADFSQWGD